MSDRIRVLHVDDDGEFADMVASFLERESDRFDVDSAESVDAALDVIDAGGIDCVIADYDMPGRTGVEFLEAVRERDPDLPFILYTGKGSEEVASEAISAGVTDYVQKAGDPDHFAVVANRIRNAVEQDRSRRKRDAVIDRVTDAIVEVDDEWRFRTVNEQAEELYGIDARDLIGHDFWEVFPEALDTRFEEVSREAMRTRDPAAITEYFGRLDGWFDVEVYPEDDGGLAFYFVDVTERRERTRELERRATRIRALRHAFPDLAFIVAADGRFLDVIAGTASRDRLYHDDPESLIGMTIAEVFPRERADTFESVVADALESGEVRTHEYRLDIDGTPRWFEARVEPLPFELEDEEAAVWVARDVTERRTREDELARQHALLEAQMEAALDGILVVDETGEIVSFNDRFVELWEIPAAVIERGDDDEALEYAVDRLRHPEEFLEAVDFLYDNPDETARDEIRLEDGRVFDRYTTPVIGEDGTHYGRLWTFRDVTDRVRHEEHLEEVTEKLEALNRVVRHDIRNDMSVILGWAGMLEDHVDEAGRDHLDRILASGEHIIELTEIARDYVESLTGDDDIVVRPTSLRGTLETEVALRDESFPGATIHLPDDVPDVAVRANEMLGSVFRNLLNNAVQHTDRDEPTVSIDVEVTDGTVLVRVADDGPGIPDDRKDAVFGKGEKGIESPGTGIGLYLVRSLVTEFGGDVWIEDNEPRGAIVTVELRLAE